MSAVVGAEVAADGLGDADVVRAQLDDLAAELGFRLKQRKNGRIALTRTDGLDLAPWQESYPYQDRLARKPYEQMKRTLQIELLKLQRSIKQSGDRILIIFEGRDAAGKGGAIRRIAENLNPRGLRVVAMEKPAAHEQGDNYLRRFLPHLPLPGEIVMFDRSWYNRAGVEHVMGFCQPEEYERFLARGARIRERLIAEGIKVVKFWFSITRAEQLRRFFDRHSDPVKSVETQRDRPGLARPVGRVHQGQAGHVPPYQPPGRPWTVVKSNDKKRARLEAMRYILSLFDYDGKDWMSLSSPTR